jgi:hypothetical protein
VLQECDGPVRDAVKAVCPLQCRLRHGAASDNPRSDQASARDQVDWAGFPIDLDLAFSPQQRDKVYVQHLMRKRGAQLSRWLPEGAQLCVCEIAAEDGNLDPDAAKAYVQSLRASKRYHRDGY